MTIRSFALTYPQLMNQALSHGFQETDKKDYWEWFWSRSKDLTKHLVHKDKQLTEELFFG